jgi:hypothetical protein
MSYPPPACRLAVADESLLTRDRCSAETGILSSILMGGRGSLIPNEVAPNSIASN